MLLKTRFYIPPLRENDVIRHRLIEQFQSINGGEIALVLAPAGYGKTTAVSQWLHHRPHSFAWLVLDQSHSSEQRFWQYVIAALQTMVPELGLKSDELLRENEIDHAVIALLNDLDEQSSAHTHQALTLVLDDFHKIENPTLLQSINLFIDHLPPSIRLLVTSRQAPDLKLALRRSSGQLKEILQHDLAFTAEEIGHFLASKDLSSDSSEKEALNKLMESTEGWVAGMQLAAMTIEQNQIPGHLTSVSQDSELQRDIADYLFEEVFSQLDKELQLFLLKTAFPKRFCTALANQLCENQMGQSYIKQLDKFNVFLVPLDNHRVWFRYHDLFRQLLIQHASELSVNQQSWIHEQAAHWFEEAGYPEDAIHHWVKLQNWTELQRLWEAAQLDRSTLMTWQHLIPHKVYLSLSSGNDTSDSQQQETMAAKVHASLDASVDVETVEPLTTREKQVMEYVKQGLTNKEIAETMHISLNTLKVHIRNLYGKMGVENRTQALLKLK